MQDNVDKDGIQVLAELNERGHEVGDPTPVAPPVGMKKSPTMAERIQMMVRRELSDRAEALGMETFEEANDFEIADDPLDPSTPYEDQFDPVERAARDRLITEEMRDRVDARHKEMRARKYPQETDNGSKPTDEGGDRADRGGSGKSGKKSENKSDKKPDVQRRGSEASGDGSDAEE